MIFKFSAGEICVIKCVFRYGIISAIILDVEIEYYNKLSNYFECIIHKHFD